MTPDHAIPLALASIDPAIVDALARTFGRAHPVLVHFPIALLLVAAGIELLRAARRAAIPSPTASACAMIGLAGALAAAPLLALWRASDLRWAPGAYRGALVLAAILVGVAGHLGGTITYGPGYLTAPLERLGTPRPSPAPAPERVTPPEPVTPPPGVEPVDFAADVWPILNESCIDCHGDVRKKGQLRLDSLAAALRGGRTGPAVVPGDAEASHLWRRVMGLDNKTRMPEDADPLTDEQIDVLRRWILTGAAWPAQLSHADSSVAETHWAYMPVKPAPVPGGNVVDAPVRTSLAALGRTISPPQAPGPLLRRVSLDLTGLPPTPEQVAAFEADPSPRRYEAEVERLLASPAFGERWASWWLDLARYADSRGYEKDQAWSMWPYRDWVINAFNADMPFDRFTVEQIAGDLLPGAGTAHLVATGFSRCSMINEEGGVDPEEYRVNAVIDRTNTVATVWLGSTLSCAQCHDHKYDPFSQKDYYRLMAFFNNTPVETVDLGSGETRVESPTIRVPHPDEERWKARAGAIEERLAAEPESALAEEWRKELAGLRSKIEQGVTTQVMKEMSPGRTTHVLARGSFLSPQEAVEPGTPAVLPGMEGLPPDRLGLARWLVRGDNPLTARVTVNRLWAQCFGRGIVATDDDFGTRGEAPSHPALLDALAVRFVRDGWSVKSILRVIVTSETYRQESSGDPAAFADDPGNALLARGPRFRLDAEMLRDQALALGGLLTQRLGGPSVFPPQPPRIWGHAYTSDDWTPSAGEDRYRRAVYTFWKRSAPYPAFVTFDAPSRQVTCTRRPRTNTPLQALTTLNDPVFVEAAAGLAARSIARAGPTDDPQAVAEAMFLAATARRPDAQERGALAGLYEARLAEYRQDPAGARALLAACPGVEPGEIEPASLAAWTVVANVVLNLDEVLSKG